MKTLINDLTKLPCVQVLQAFARAEKRLKPNWTEMFSEVYDELPSDLRLGRIDRFCSFCFMPYLLRRLT
jgi:hypothetical protein